jgi:hypothetical protein
VDRQYELHYSERYTWEEFVAVNVEACGVLERLDAGGGEAVVTQLTRVEHAVGA